MTDGLVAKWAAITTFFLFLTTISKLLILNRCCFQCHTPKNKKKLAMAAIWLPWQLSPTVIYQMKDWPKIRWNTESSIALSIIFLGFLVKNKSVGKGSPFGYHENCHQPLPSERLTQLKLEHWKQHSSINNIFDLFGHK